MHSARIHCPGQSIAIQNKGRNRNSNVMGGQRSKESLLLSNAKENHHPKSISGNPSLNRSDVTSGLAVEDLLLSLLPECVSPGCGDEL